MHGVVGRPVQPRTEPGNRRPAGLGPRPSHRSRGPRAEAESRLSLAWLVPLGVAAVVTTVAVQGLVLVVDLPADSKRSHGGRDVDDRGRCGRPGRGPAAADAVQAAVATVVVALTATATAVLAWPMHGTYYFGGLMSDQQFRTQYLTRLATGHALADMN